jgi:hypothetical protein
MSSASDDDRLWREVHAAESAFIRARVAFVRGAHDPTSVLRRALGRPPERGTALRVLELLPESFSRPLLDTLVASASVGHADVGLVRSVIGRIDRAWLLGEIEAHVRTQLATGGEEEYRRLAELYEELDETLWRQHLDRCAVHADPAIREIAEDARAAFTSS